MASPRNPAGGAAEEEANLAAQESLPAIIGHSADLVHPNTPLPSLARRVWNALKPPPSLRPRRRLTPGQKRLLISGGSALAVIVLAGGTWSYLGSAQQRAQAQFDQGTRLMTPGTYSGAVQRFDRAIRIWPHFAQAYYERGIAHHLLGDADTAAADFTQAIEENPQFGAAYTERGTILRDRGDLTGALQDFSRAVELEPSANGFYQRGQAYASLGQMEKALEDFDRAIAELRDAPYVYRARAEVKRKLGDLAGYKADHDVAIQAEYHDGPRAWVDQPLPADAPAPVEDPGKKLPAPGGGRGHRKK